MSERRSPPSPLSGGVMPYDPLIHAYRSAGTDWTWCRLAPTSEADPQRTLATSSTICASERQLALPLSTRNGTIRWRKQRQNAPVVLSNEAIGRGDAILIVLFLARRSVGRSRRVLSNSRPASGR